MTDEQKARLAELQAKLDSGETLSEEEQAEYNELKALETPPTPVEETPVDAPDNGDNGETVV